MIRFYRLLKTTSCLLLLALGLISASHAAEPFTAEKFAEAQKSGASVLLHFHADWCPTCRSQQKALKVLEEKGQLKGILVLTTDYDRETALKKSLKVTQQSTFVAFQGATETGRKGGDTDADEIGKFLAASFSKKGLQSRLDAMKAGSAGHLPPEKLAVMEAATEKLRASEITKKALPVGARFPDVELKNYLGKKIRIQSLLKSGPVIVTFYRGGWCPYCNAQLKAFQDVLPRLKSAGAQLVAISPETPKNAAETVGKDALEFEVLSDPGNRVAKKLGLVFGVTPELKKIYQDFGIDLAQSQANPDWELPIPATYVIQKDGKVSYAFLDVDYTRRADPEEILTLLQGS